MQEYDVTVHYQGRAEYKVKAPTALAARKRAMGLFDDGVPSQGVEDLDSLEITGLVVEEEEEGAEAPFSF